MAVLEILDARGTTHANLDRSPIIVGRHCGCDVVFAEDPTVSGRHAALEELGGIWSVRDLASKNGTYVNGKLINGSRALRHEDVVSLGRIQMKFRDSGLDEASSTAPLAPCPDLTRGQKQVLIELVRPILRPTGPVVQPAQVKDIAEKLFVGRGAVQAQLGVLYDKFGIAETGENDRRVRLSNEAIRRGCVRNDDLGSPEDPQG